MALFPSMIALACAVGACAPTQAEDGARAEVQEAQFRVPAPAPSPRRPTKDIPASSPAEVGKPTFVLIGELTQGGWIRGLAPRGAVSATLDGQPLELADDLSFFAAFDRDAGETALLVAKFPDGKALGMQVDVSPRKWNIERVNVSKGTGRSSEAWWKKREPEWLAIKNAREKVTGATGWQQDFIWPVKGRISGRFGRQRIYRDGPGSYHSGIDIAPGNGVPYVAPADGVVVLARTGFSLEGGIIIIDHGAGLNSAFLHSSKIAVTEGQAVKQGEYIGNVGSTGRSTGPHLHWSLKWNDARLDPLLFTGPMD